MKEELERINYMFYAGIPGKISGMSEEAQKQDFANYHFIADVFARLATLSQEKKIAIIEILESEMTSEEQSKYEELKKTLQQEI